MIVRVNRLKNMIVENLKKEEKLVMIIHVQSKPEVKVLGVKSSTSNLRLKVLKACPMKQSR